MPQSSVTLRKTQDAAGEGRMSHSIIERGGEPAGYLIAYSG
jgi:hypothetical protein